MDRAKPSTPPPNTLEESLDEALRESFPASDPPAVSSPTNHRSTSS